MCVASPSGIAAPQNFHERRTGCGEFLANRLRLARIENIWLNLDEANDMDPDVREKAYKFIARSYVLPEYTHTGRQRHHIRREVFLTNTKEEENCAAIYSLAKVLEPAEFRSSGGDDVYMCEYSYDQNFSRFRRRTEWEDSDFSEDEFDVEAKNIRWSEGESSSDDDDEEYDNRKEKKRARGRQLPIKGKQTAAALKKGTKASLEWKETIGLKIKEEKLRLDFFEKQRIRQEQQRAKVESDKQMALERQNVREEKQRIKDEQQKIFF